MSMIWLFDISHISCCEFPGKDDSAVDILGPITAHLHVVDGSGVDSEGLDIGDGTINFKDLGERLAKVAPNVPFIPEIWQGHKDSGAGFWRALRKLDGLL